MAAEGVFIIREAAGQKRELRLEGRARPHQPFETETSQVLAVARYPGNAVKSTQALGPSDEPIVLTGVVKDKWFSDGYSDALKKIMRSLCLEGEVLELETLDWTRKGQLKRVRIADRWRGHFEYELEFEILNTADPDEIVAFDVIETPETEVRAPEAGVAAVTSVRDAAPVGTSAAAFETFDEALGTAQQAMTEAVSTVLQSRAIQDPRRVLDSARRVFALVQTVQTEGERMRSVLRGLVPSTAGVLTDGIGVLRQATFLGRLRRDTNTLVSSAGRSARFFEELSIERVRTTVIGRAGHTLAELALRFYGTPHDWPRIARANGLRENLLAASAILVVPD